MPVQELREYVAPSRQAAGLINFTLARCAATKSYIASARVRRLRGQVTLPATDTACHCQPVAGSVVDTVRQQLHLIFGKAFLCIQNIVASQRLGGGAALLDCTVLRIGGYTRSRNLLSDPMQMPMGGHSDSSCHGCATLPG